ncbi:glycosyltransferase [Dokdonia sinensis]|uniref:Glycosyltransferase n=1 Tax=Dokdonia sinensis TaxID=2479847 RepID=A0A3M0G3C6_9FLAO|nr:glycosyltransferase family 2 protein [Dokdonia sinensis]RMB59424.1 glycosyltransferase [Dokdonia sinensis]
MKTALLLSTYNWPEALELILKSIQIQTQAPDELVIADDGSTTETKDLIDTFRTQVSYPVNHIWHEDNGFQKSIILNKAVAAINADYIIQVDGDCILHNKFVADHIAFAKANQYLYGSRVNIKEEFAQSIVSEGKINFNLRSKQIKNKMRTIHSPVLSNFFKPQQKISKKLRGCNVSYWRSDFIAANGYNEDMTGWGKEDSEFILRLVNAGIKGRRLRYRGIVFHIWHKISSKQRLSINEDIQQETIAMNKTSCENGVNKYL